MFSVGPVVVGVLCFGGTLIPSEESAAFHSCSNFDMHAFNVSFSNLSLSTTFSSSTSMSGMVSREEVDVMEARDDDCKDERDLVEEAIDDRDDWGVKVGVGGPWATV